MVEMSESLRKMMALISGSKDPAAISAVMEVQQQIVTLMEEDRKLRNKNIQLENQLLDKASLKFHDNCYWRGNGGPFCSRCFDVDGLLVRMADVSNSEYTTWYIYECNNCKSKVYTHLELPDNLKTI